MIIKIPGNSTPKLPIYKYTANIQNIHIKKIPDMLKKNNSVIVSTFRVIIKCNLMSFPYRTPQFPLANLLRPKENNVTFTEHNSPLYNCVNLPKHVSLNYAYNLVSTWNHIIIETSIIQQGWSRALPHVVVVYMTQRTRPYTSFRWCIPPLASAIIKTVDIVLYSYIIVYTSRILHHPAIWIECMQVRLLLWLIIMIQNSFPNGFVLTRVGLKINCRRL